MNQVVFRGTLVVLAHMIVLFGHGATHLHLQIAPSHWQRAFIAIAIFATPVLAALLFWTRWQRIGITLLGICLEGSLLFGDSVFNPIHSHWNIGFSVTAVLLAVVELTGCVWCFVPRRYSWKSGFKAIES